jgi:hypothetical protein
MSAVLQRQLPGVSRITRGGLRIEVESVSGDAVHVRLRPEHIAAGISDGPRVALSLSLEDARDLAALLQAHAAGASS